MDRLNYTERSETSKISYKTQIRNGNNTAHAILGSLRQMRTNTCRKYNKYFANYEHIFQQIGFHSTVSLIGHIQKKNTHLRSFKIRFAIIRNLIHVVLNERKNRERIIADKFFQHQSRIEIEYEIPLFRSISLNHSHKNVSSVNKLTSVAFKLLHTPKVNYYRIVYYKKYYHTLLLFTSNFILLKLYA